MTNINLSAPVIDYDLTSPEKLLGGNYVTFINPDDTRIERNGDTRITRNGDTRIAHNTGAGYPPILTAHLIDMDLTASERG